MIIYILLVTYKERALNEVGGCKTRINGRSLSWSPICGVIGISVRVQVWNARRYEDVKETISVVWDMVV